MIAEPDKPGDAENQGEPGNPANSGDQWNLRQGGDLHNLAKESDRRPDGKFLPGHSMGRPKGSPNKLTAIFKRDLLAVYHKRGGPAMLERLDDKTFVEVVVKILPKEIALDTDGLTAEDVALQLIAMRGERV